MSGPKIAPVSHAAPRAREVAPRATHASIPELRAALARAHLRVTGEAASPRFLDVLTAQAALETGRGEHMYNYNFGGIKGAGPSGATAVLRTKEIVGGKAVEIRDGFRAYGSLDEGAVDYVRLLRDRFGGAVSAAERGDVDGFAHALKGAGYYTADATEYASALRGITREIANVPPGARGLLDATSGLGGVPSLDALPAGADFASSDVLTRVLDAVRASTARIADPVDEVAKPT